MKILFINANKNGNTKALADKMLQGKSYETLNLTDYRIGCSGTVDDGSRRLHHETLCDSVRHGIRRHGHQCKGSCSAAE